MSIRRLLLILTTFAIGGSLTGYLGRRLMHLANFENVILNIVLYILLIVILWPVMVLIVSIPLGQFAFFKNYIARMAARMKITQPQTPNPKLQTPKRLAIFASGAGSNAQKIIDHFRNSPLATVALIVCNKPGAGVTLIANKENIPLCMIEKERFFRGDSYLPELENVNTDLIVLAGFLWKIPQMLIDTFPKRIINIHPALLPKYGGRGMYGQYVHEAVLNAGEMQSGITVHYVDEHYDNGDVIFQTACPVMEGDSPAQLAVRIHELEHLYYPQVIEDLVKKL